MGHRQHVGVIAYEMEGARSGVGRYLEGLLGGLPATEDWRWTLFFKGDPFEHPLFDSPAITPLFDRRPAARPVLWEQTRLPRLLRGLELDLLFSPGYSLPPLARVPMVVTLHDLSFEHLRGEFRWREGLRRRLLARSAARRARRVLVDTEAMALDLRETYGVESRRLGVVPLAVEARFFDPLRVEGALEALGVRPPYLLCLGSILPRRRIDLVLEAFARVSREPLSLVLAGSDRLPQAGQLDAWIAASPAGGRVHRISYVPESALPELYARAEATLSLSSYEGYGLPPLESLAAGTPALVSPGMALDDLAPDYPHRVELEAGAVARGLEALLEAPNAGALERARAAVRALSWRRCSERFLAELRLAAAGAKG
ncbi:MAG: glycosyltransferase [Acidobacteriota bacterium]